MSFPKIMLALGVGFAVFAACRAETKAAFFAPDKPMEAIAAEFGKCFEDNKDVKMDIIDRISTDNLSRYKTLILWNSAIEPFEFVAGRNNLFSADAKVVRGWVENGGGLFCFRDAVGFKKHNSLPLFADAAEGVSNYYPDNNAYARECVVTCSHPIVKDIVPGSRFVVSYFDLISLKPGTQGVSVVRGVGKTPGGGIVDDPVVVVANIGKGRYVASGLATGLHASNTPISPIGVERKILVNAVNWLSGATMSSDCSASPETTKKGEILGPRNLVDNASMEMIENGFPVGWGIVGGSGVVEHGVTDKEKHDGRYSLYFTAKRYFTRQDGNAVVSGGIQTCKADWRENRADCVVNPSTAYRFTFWMKSTAPYVRISTYQYDDDQKKRRNQPTNLDWLKPVDGEWHQYSGVFTTGPRTRSLALAFRLEGREMAGAYPAIPLGATVYIDDVVITEVETLSSLLEERERNFVRMEKADWRKSDGAIPTVNATALATPLEFDRAYLEFPAYVNSPRGWSRVDLNGLWKIKKFYGVKNAENDCPGVKEGFWRADCRDDDWGRRFVPSCWYSDDTPEQSKQAHSLLRYLIEKMEKKLPFPWVGWYRREFSLPIIGKDNRAILNFEGVSYKCEVWVNGNRIGKHTGGKTPFSFDITEAVKDGDGNVIAVSVFDPVKVYDWGHWGIGGIWNSVYIDIVPSVYSRRTLITPNLDKSLIEVEAWIDNAIGAERSIALSAVVRAYPTPLSIGPEYDETSNLKEFQLKKGVNRIHFEVAMKDPVRWTPKNPFLYTLELKNGDRFIGKSRFGFKTFVAKGRDFMLNGKPIFLRGECVTISYHHLMPALINPSEKEFIFFKKMMMTKKQLNINNVYYMVMPMPASHYDLLDELGIIAYADWHAAQANYPLNDPIQSEDDIREMDAWVYSAYNHPSQCLWSLGGELFERDSPKFVKSYDDLLNPIYDGIKKIDKQGRPICQSSGRNYTRESKTDIWDFHAYPGGISRAWTYEDAIVDNKIETMRITRGPRDIPLIQYEVGGFDRRVNIDDKACLDAGFRADNDWDKDAFIRFAQMAPTERLGARSVSGLYGLRRRLKDLEKYERFGVGNQKMMTREFIAMARCNGFLVGLGLNKDPFAYAAILDNDASRLGNARATLNYDNDDLTRKVFVASEAYEDLKRSYAPALICWTLYPQNNFAGKTFRATTYVVNDTEEELGDLTARVLLKDQAGKILSDTSARLANVPDYKRLTFPYAFDFPSDLKTGDYRAELFLYEKEKVIADNYHELYVLGRNDLGAPIRSNKKIAVYDHGGQILGREEKSVRFILKSLDIPFVSIEDFKDLDKYDVLIIGAYSVSPLLSEEGARVNAWLRRGGRLLSFEQMVSGAAPFLPQIQIVMANHPNISAEIVTITHPAFKNLSCYNFFRWNGYAPGVTICPGALFNSGLQPLNKAVVATGATSMPRATLQALSMLLADVKVGEGIAVLNQMEAICRYNDDSVATRYVNNLIGYILSDETGYSTALDTYSFGNVDPYECCLVDLGKGERFKTNGIAFNMSEKGVSLPTKGQSALIDLSKNALYDEQYAAKYDAEHVDEGSLRRDYVECFYFLYGCDSVSEGKTAAALILNYAEGGSETHKLVLTGGVNIAGGDIARDLPQAAYAGNGLFAIAWVNPNPGRKIKSLQVTCVDAKGFRLKGVSAKLERASLHEKKL